MIKTRLVLLAGTQGSERIAAVMGVLDQFADLRPAAVLFEGGLVPTQFDQIAEVRVQALGFGCPCCVGALPLRVTLVRTLRQHPALIVLAALNSVEPAQLVHVLEQHFAELVTLDVRL